MVADVQEDCSEGGAQGKAKRPDYFPVRKPSCPVTGEILTLYLQAVNAGFLESVLTLSQGQCKSPHRRLLHATLFYG